MGLVIILSLLSLTTFGAGCGVAAFMTGVFHEIEALVLFLISSIFFVGAAILAALVDIENG